MIHYWKPRISGEIEFSSLGLLNQVFVAGSSPRRTFLYLSVYRKMSFLDFFKPPSKDRFPYLPRSHPVPAYHKDVIYFTAAEFSLQGYTAFCGRFTAELDLFIGHVICYNTI